MSDRPDLATRGLRRWMVRSGPVVALVALVLSLPGGGVWTNSGVGTRAGTPAAILFGGLVFGALNALVAAGIVLVYRTARVVNFAQAAMGVIGATFTFSLMQLNRWPYLAAAIVGVLASVGVGALVELGIIRRFFTAPRVALTVLTIAVGGLLAGATNVVLLIPIFPEGSGVPDLSAPLRLPLPSFSFGVGDLPLKFGFGHVLALGAAVCVLAGLGAFLRFSRVGIAIRASAENSERAELLGISVRTLSTIVWSVAAGMSGLSIVLNATANGAVTVTGFGPTSLLPALAAAVIGKLRSLPDAIAAAIGITLATESFRWSFPGDTATVDSGLFLVVAVALVLHRRALGRLSDEAQSWEATAEVRDTPKELSRLGTTRFWRALAAAIALAFVAVLPWITSSDATFLAGFAALNAIVLLSLVVLTGWAGQVSLGQYAFVAMGAVVGGALTSKLGVPFWVAVPLTAAITAGLAVIVGMPALRVKGLMLAVATFAFAFAVERALFNRDWFGWLLPRSINRPTLFFLDFEDERSMYYLSVAALLAALVLVANARRSRIGRILIAVRENEANLESFGVAAVKAKLLAFGLSGFLCGTAGALIAHHQREVVQAGFAATESLDVFLLAVVGGIGSVWGALLGAAYTTALGYVDDATLSFLAGPLGTLLVLYLLPGGLVSFVFGMRDSVYRIVAHRRRIAVPGFAPGLGRAAAGDDRAPLAEPSSSGALAHVVGAGRYAPTSTLHGLGGLLSPSRRVLAAADVAALAAAAESVAPDAGAEGDERERAAVGGS